MLVRSRTPYGVRGLKSQLINEDRVLYCRTPYGVRGLKSKAALDGVARTMVALRMGCVD